MPRPFDTDPRLLSHFPSPEDLQDALGASPSAREVFVRLWLTEGVPFAFLSAPAVYEDLRGWLGDRLKVHPKEITLIGSARMGYSLKPRPVLGRAFHSASDLDLGVVSLPFFQRIESAFGAFVGDYQKGAVAPRNQQERGFWDENIRFGRRNIPRGFLDCNKIPNLARYPVAQQVSQLMWMLVKRLEVTSGVPVVRHASIRVYRDWPSLIAIASLNLKKALTAA